MQYTQCVGCTTISAGRAITSIGIRRADLETRRFIHGCPRADISRARNLVQSESLLKLPDPWKRRSSIAFARCIVIDNVFLGVSKVKGMIGESRMHRKSPPFFLRIRADERIGRNKKYQNKQYQGAPKKAGGIPGPIYKAIWFPDVEKFVSGLSPTQRRVLAIVFVGVLAGVAWFRNLGAAGLVDDTEPLFAEAARQMLVTGDFITPQFNSQPRFDKPILIYWLMALSGKLFGPTVWALRLPSAICALGVLIGLLLTVKHFGLNLSPELHSQSNERSATNLGDHYLPAIITAAAFALNLEVVAWGSTALSDMLLTSTLGATLLSFFWGYAGRELSPLRHGWGYPLSAFFMGLAFLSKGPVGILFPVCVCGSFLLCTGELSRVLMEELPYVKGILVLLLINLPWYGVMASKHGLVYLSTFFGYHNLERFVSGVNNHTGRPWWYGMAVVLIMYLPWSLSLPPSLLQANPRKESWRIAERWQRLPLFAVTWLAAGFTIFAVSSTQLPSYYLPVAPAVAMLAGAHLSQRAEHQTNGVATGLAPAFLYQLSAGLFWFSPALLQASGDATACKIGKLLGESHLHQIALLILGFAGTMATRTAEFAKLYGSQLQPTNVRPSEEPGSQRSLLPLWVLHTAAMLAFLVAFFTPVYQVADSVRQSPLRQLSSTAAELQQTGEPLVMVGTRMPSVVFYSKLPTAFFDTTQEASTVLQQEAAPGVRSALILTETDWEENAQSAELLASAGNYKLIRVHMNLNPTLE